jgi:hypothetical protein
MNVTRKTEDLPRDAGGGDRGSRGSTPQGGGSQDEAQGRRIQSGLFQRLRGASGRAEGGWMEEEWLEREREREREREKREKGQMLADQDAQLKEFRIELLARCERE